ncbi:MAG: hypothetical protein H3C47_07895 [Candidatus Cloacimonetes bacterium]|nr:hypothetical protein [Candidatus Cloacimonadota bacterium]
MLVFLNLEVKRLSLRLDAAPALITKVTETSEYFEVRQQILRDGILDPILVRCYPDNRLEVETGVQRTLIARELQIPSLWAFVYPFPDPDFPMPEIMGQVISCQAEILDKFKTCPPVLVDILGYINNRTIIVP